MSSAPKLVNISDLRIYPIKSCRGISLESTTLTRQGLLHDRKWMFVDANNNFITIRQKSQMTLIKTAIDNATQTLKVTLPAVEEAGLKERQFQVPLNADQIYLSQHCKKIDVVIWEYNTDAYTYTSPDIADAVRDFFKTIDPKSDVKFVMKGPTARIAKGNGAPNRLGRTETVNFPDVLPILVASEASLSELNERLTKGGHDEISIERFRPNIIVKSGHSRSYGLDDGDEDDEVDKDEDGNGEKAESEIKTDEEELEAWEEDQWRTIRINPSQKQLSTSMSMSQDQTQGGFLAALISTLQSIILLFLRWFPSTRNNMTQGISTERKTNNNNIDYKDEGKDEGKDKEEKQEEDIILDVSARCARCQVPNVDPSTGIKNAKNQPWNTLVSYRRVDPGIKFKPCFGMLCCPRTMGPVNIGMKIQVLETLNKAKGEEHFYLKGF